MYLKSKNLTIAVQVNGKLRATIEVDSDLEKEEIIKLAKQNEKVSKWLIDGKSTKEVFVPNKLVNFVV
jgi:leucyl-tRNA synthetase